MEALAVSLASLHGVVLKQDIDTEFRQDAQGRLLPLRRRVKSTTVSGGTAAARAEMVEVLRRHEIAAEPGRIEGWLARLSVRVPKWQEDAFTEELRLEEFSRFLSRYPADVTQAALLEHGWRRWPSIVELQEVCEALFRPRQALREALEQPLVPEATRGPRIPPDRHAAIMAEVFGGRLGADGRLRA